MAVLAEDLDEMIAERAGASLLSQPVGAFLAALERPDVAPQLFDYCARNLLEKPGIADALASNRNCPLAFLIPAVQYLSTHTVQALMDDLGRLSSAPALAGALARSSSITAEQRHQLLELQQGAADRAAIVEAVAAAEPDRAKHPTMLQKLMRMSVIERVQMALKGNREARLVLIRDPCRVVQRAVLQSPHLAEREAEAYAAMTSLTEEILRLIAINRKFRKNYTVVLNLMNNPRTPLDVSLNLLPNITGNDLKLLATNRNVSDTLRKMAMKLLRQRSQTRQSS